MSTIEIPIASSSPHFTQENEIFGNAFLLEFEWIEREGFWLLHIADGGEQPKALGIRLQPDWPLYTHHETTRPFTFMLLAKSLGQALERLTLHQHFVLVAHAAF